MTLARKMNKQKGYKLEFFAQEKHTSHDTAVSKARWTIAIKHWNTAGIRFGVFKYSNTQLNALLEAVNSMLPLRMPPLLLKRIISKNATARRYVAFTPANSAW